MNSPLAKGRKDFKLAIEYDQGFNDGTKEGKKRITDLEAALQGMLPFIKDDFPKGTGVNHGTCATDQYQKACDAVIKVLEGST